MGLGFLPLVVGPINVRVGLSAPLQNRFDFPGSLCSAIGTVKAAQKPDVDTQLWFLGVPTLAHGSEDQEFLYFHRKTNLSSGPYKCYMVFWPSVFVFVARTPRAPSPFASLMAGVLD